MLPLREGVRMGLADPCERRVGTVCPMWRMGLGVLVVLWGLVTGTYLIAVSFLRAQRLRPHQFEAR